MGESLARIPFRNRVLKSLSPEDFALLRPSLHRVELDIKAQLEIAHQPIRNGYFPERGIASVVATMTGGRQCEVGIFGHDGMTGCRHSRTGQLFQRDLYPGRRQWLAPVG